MPDPTTADIIAKLDEQAATYQAALDAQAEAMAAVTADLKRIADALPPYLLGLDARQEEIERQKKTATMLAEHHARRSA